MKTKTFLFLALLCMVAQGAWATDYSVKNDSELRTAIADNGANITVTADIDLSNSTLSIAAGTTVTIDLGGHTLDRKLTKRGDGGGQVITVRENATLYLSNGTLKGGWGGNGGGIVNEGGTANLSNVTITGCVGDDRGGGIVNYGTLTIDGCTITGNTAKANGGAGIWNDGSATLNMQGTNTIKDNWKPNGIRSNLYLKNGSVITITGDLADSKVFVDMETLGTFTSGYSTYNDGHPAGFFTADKQSITGMRLVAGEAQLNNAIPEGGVYYVERSWNETAKRVEATFCTLEENQYITLTGSDDDTYLDPGWYVVKGSDVVYDDYLYMNGGGEYHLILCDGASLKAEFFIVNSPNVLHIHGQANDTGKMISTYVYNFVAHKCAGIGGTDDNANGPIFIHGGDIDVHATLSSAGIGGGGYASQGGAITIYGGTVRAQGGYEPGGSAGSGSGGGAGIGGGRNGDGGIVNIYGGSVYATGKGSTSGAAGIGSGSYAESSGTISIYGGYVEAKGYDGAAGIGGGQGTNGADVTIHGGTVKAEGKTEGPGIGAGKNDDNSITYAGTLTVTGGKVYAYGGSQRGAGIGGGWNTNGSNVTISGGYVYAEGGKYAAGIGSGCEYISGGERHGGTLTVTGGYVEAHGGEDGAGIGGGEDADGGTVNISGGEVRAYGNDYGAGIGGGENGTGGNVTITGGIVVAQSGGDQRAIGAGYGSDNHGSLSFADNLGVFVTTDLYRSQKANRVKDCREYKDVRINQCAHGGASFSIVDAEKHSISGCDWCSAGDETHTFGSDGDCGACGLISLADDADNSGIIKHWDDETKSVALSGRTLYKDGDWNTLCLPFDIDDISTSPLAGATIMELDTKGVYEGNQTGFNASTGTLYLYFKNASEIEAGKPYIIKWGSGSNIVNPAFIDIRVTSADPEVITSDVGKVQFIGIYDPAMIYSAANDNLYLGAENTLYWPSEVYTLNAFRAYFHVDLSGGSPVRSFKLNLSGSDVTGLSEAKADSSLFTLHSSLPAEGWYDLFGRKLNGKPTQPGIYLNNGKKIVISD